MELIDLIQSIDIVEYLSQFMDFEQRGQEFWALSPFKDEKTPSFSVRRETGQFFDYSSGIGGNVFTFVKYFNRCSTKEAVKLLEQYANVKLDDENAPKRMKLDATSCCRRFQKAESRIKESKSVILRDDYMNRFEYNPEKLKIWRDEGITPDTMERFQVKYDSFSDCIVYPIRDVNGNIVNIGGRTLDPHYKEKKLRKYTYFKPWGTMATIYGFAENLDEIKRRHEIILFEGAKSVLIADGWGIKNVGAILTSHLNPNQMKILAKLGCNVVFALDKDVAVREDHNIAKLKNYVNVSYIKDTQGLLNDKDSPVDQGEAIFRELYERRVRYR